MQPDRGVGLERLRDESGAVALIVVLVLAFVLLGMLAVVVDSGGLYSERRSLQTVADAAALAGVQELLTNDTGAADSVARSYADSNLVNANTAAAVSVDFPEAKTIHVQVTNPAKAIHFSQVLGMDTSPVGASATAAIQSPSAYSRRVMPFGVMSEEPSGTAPFGYTYNTPVQLKWSAVDNAAGNFEFIDIIGSPEQAAGGANQIKDALRYGGAPNEVYLNANYYTQTGNMAPTITSLSTWIGADTDSFDDVTKVNDDGTAQILDFACHRLIVCPIIVYYGPDGIEYRWDNVNGSKLVRVIGFAWFYVENWKKEGNDCYVNGRFVMPVGPEYASEWGPVDPYGAIAYRLIH